MENNQFRQQLYQLLSDWKAYGKRDKRVNWMGSSIPNQLRILIRDELGIEMNFSPKNPLTLMEMLCLILLSVWEKNRDIVAELLEIKPSSTLQYENRIRMKLQVDCRTKAFHMALKKGYLSLIS